MNDDPAIDLPIGDPVEPAKIRFPTRTPLEGRYVHLTPTVEADGDALFECIRGVEHDWIWTYMPFGPFDSVEAMRAWAAEFEVSDDTLMFTARDAPTGDAVGAYSMLNVVPEHRRLELGNIWFTPPAHGTPVVTESAYLMLCEAFETLTYRRVEWKCDSLNRRSRQAAERLGFTFEGVFRKHMIRRGHNRDTAWYSMTNEDWPRRKSNMERWLYENDDGKLSLRALNRPFIPWEQSAE